MKFIGEVAFPPEPFNTHVRKGIAGDKLGEGLEGIKPRSCTSPITAWVAALSASMIISAPRPAPLSVKYTASGLMPSSTSPSFSRRCPCGHRC